MNNKIRIALELARAQLQEDRQALIDSHTIPARTADSAARLDGIAVEPLARYDAALAAIAEVLPEIDTQGNQQRALDVQVGGQHYKDLAIQPVEFIHKNRIGYMEGNAVKYLTRWRHKNGIEDLKKARHYIDLLIEMEGGA